MRGVSGANFVFDWNPNIGGPWNLMNCWPGASYVDAVGVDVYNSYWQSWPGEPTVWNSLLSDTQNGYSQGLNWLVSIGTQYNKPLTLPEWGLGFNTNGEETGGTSPGQTTYGDDPTFVNNLASYITTHSVLEAGVWDSGSDPLPNSGNAPNATTAFLTSFK